MTNRPTLDEAEPHDIAVRLNELLLERGMTLTELSNRVGVTLANMSILKNGRAKAIRFSTLTRLCEVLQCQPGDLLTHQPHDTKADRDAMGNGRRTS